MRIIGGEWRGRKIEEPRGRDVTRPTTDRVREACASMVMSRSTSIWTRSACWTLLAAPAPGNRDALAWRPHAHHV